MKGVGIWLSFPLIVIAWNITDKMDQQNIDRLVDGITWALIILAVLVPVGLYVVAAWRHHDELSMSLRRHQHNQAQRRPQQVQLQMSGAPAPRQAPMAGGWGPPPQLLDAHPDQFGSFQVENNSFQAMEDWQ